MLGVVAFMFRNDKNTENDMPSELPPECCSEIIDIDPQSDKKNAHGEDSSQL